MNLSPYDTIGVKGASVRIIVGGLLIGVIILIVLFLVEPPREVIVVVTPLPTPTVDIRPVCTDEGRGWWYCQ